MELNEYDKEILVTQSKPVSLLATLVGKPRRSLAPYKDFKYKDKQAYVHNGVYYYDKN